MDRKLHELRTGFNEKVQSCLKTLFYLVRP